MKQPMESFVRDLKHGVRVLLRTPAVTLLMIFALALGIGMNASSFISIGALVLHPFPFPSLDRIMMLQESMPRLPNEREAAAPANFRDWQEQNRSFQRMAAFRPVEAALTSSGEPERVDATAVTADFFPLLGIAPELGRTFRPDEIETAHARVTVVSHGFWVRRLSASPAAVGETVSLDGRRYSIVGVMPSDFNFPLENEIWVPLTLTNAQAADRAGRNLSVLGLLKPGVSTAAARADMQTIALRLARRYPDANEGRTVVVTPLRELTNAIGSRFVVVLMAASGFVLLLACVNIANLQLVQAVRRQREVAVRTALGAGRLEILRQLATESILIGIPGGALGLCLASWDIAARMRYLVPPQVFYWVAGMRNMRVDGTVAWFAFALALAAAMLCTLPAALHLISRRVTQETNESLKAGGRGGDSRSAGRLRNIFAIAEIALALVLLIGAGLQVRAFNRMLEVNSGFNPKNLLTMQTTLAAGRYATPEQIRTFSVRALAALERLPGVRSVAVNSVSGQATAFLQEGRPAPRPGEPRPLIHAVTPQYFATLRLPILSGRGIGDQDSENSPAVVVVNQTIARHYWPAADPIGQHIRWSASGPWLTVVGVSGDVKDWFSGRPSPRAYVPFAQAPVRSLSLLLRTAAHPMMAARAATAQVHQIDPLQPVFDVKSMDQQIFEETSGVRASAIMMSGYALIAFLLAISGVYAVVSYSVAQRTHEIGIRIALGADRGRVMRLTLGQALRIAGAGLAIGIPAAFALTRLMAGVLYNTIALDAVTFAAFAGSLAFCALLAGYVPARRAAATDPIAALRQE